MASTRSIVRSAAAALVAAAAFGLPGPAAVAQTPVPSEGTGDVPSVAVVPADSKPDDPNGGQWFHISLQPGQLGTLRAKVGNPADVAQQVTFTIQDLVFADDGTPSLNDGVQTDVGAWGVLPTKTLVIQPQQIFTVPFQIRVPSGADPGDHVGVLVATTTNLQGNFKVNRRVATRLYVTLPGDTTASYVITSVAPRRDSAFFPGTITTKVRLRNDGRVRVEPAVTVGGTRASGPSVLLSRSVEEYVATTKVPWYGGLVKLPVHVETEDGLTRTAEKTVVVIPWGLLVGLTLLAAVTWLTLRWWRKRTGKVAGLRADIERLERMVVRTPEPAAAASAAAPDVDDEVHALLAALKRAQRSGSASSVARLALSLHDAGGESTSWLVAALKAGDTPYRDELVRALADADPAAVATALGRGAADQALLAEIAAARLPAPAPATATRRARAPRAPKPAGTAPVAEAAGKPVPKPRAPRAGKPAESKAPGAKPTGRSR